MKTPENLTIEHDGRITLPNDLRDRYGLAEDTTVRVIETRAGILLVPLTQELMSEALAAELQDWQSLGTNSSETFPYDEGR
jgi:AbrB family looped-hinge helix DNA binding protein